MAKQKVVSRHWVKPGDYGTKPKGPSRRQVKRAAAKAARRGQLQLEQELQAMLDAMDRDGALDLTLATVKTVAGPTSEKE